jgi:Flp pilus assembly pilin Flp
MKKLFSRFYKEEDGRVVEYIIILSVIAVIVAFAFPRLRDVVEEWFNEALKNEEKGMSE